MGKDEFDDEVVAMVLRGEIGQQTAKQDLQQAIGCAVPIPLVIAVGVTLMFEGGLFFFTAALAVSMVVVGAPCGFLVWRILRDAKASRTPTATMHDLVFGEIRRYRSGSWQGEVVMPMLNRAVDIRIYAPESGPSDRQRRLCEEIQQRLADLWPEMQHVLWDYVSEICKFEGRDQPGEFELGEISIPHDTPENIERALWTLQFTEDLSEEEENYMGYFVDIHNWKVDGVTAVD